MFFQARGSQRICIEAAIHRISQRRQTIGARDPYFVFGGANLRFELRKLRAPRNIVCVELLKLRVDGHG